MALPTEFRSQSKTIGNSSIKHPIYTFTINLSRSNSEAFGPSTNQSNGTVLHPDMYSNSPDSGRTAAAQHAVGKSTWIPGALLGENVIINDDGTITAYGMKAAYLKKAFADVANPMLTLTNNAPYTSTTIGNVADTWNHPSKVGMVAGGAATVLYVDN